MWCIPQSPQTLPLLNIGKHRQTSANIGKNRQKSLQRSWFSSYGRSDHPAW